jgi:hypothetical protein
MRRGTLCASHGTRRLAGARDAHTRSPPSAWELLVGPWAMPRGGRGPRRHRAHPPVLVVTGTATPAVALIIVFTASHGLVPLPATLAWRASARYTEARPIPSRRAIADAPKCSSRCSRRISVGSMDGFRPR